jgi:hypothetical protein
MKAQQTKATVLEKILKYWEDTMFTFWFQFSLKKIQPLGPVAHWESFREYARTFCVGQKFDMARYYDVPEDVDLGSFKIIPLMLVSWLSNSKRVFRVSGDMQSRLESIRLGNMRLSDLVFPFPSFCVELGMELLGSNGSNYDFILVHDTNKLLFPDLPENKIRSFTTFSSKNTTYCGMSREKMAELRSHLQRGYTSGKDLRRDVEYLKQVALQGGRTVSAGETLLINIQKDDLIEDYLEGLVNAGLTKADLARVRLVFNLCIYLQSLPPLFQNEEGVKWKEELLPAQTSDRVFIRSANICEITGKHIIDSMIVDERGEKVQGAGGWELPPHWRRAHRRRPPGKGNDPTAEKTVKVKHALVRADKIQEFGGTTGSISEVKP